MKKVKFSLPTRSLDIIDTLTDKLESFKSVKLFTANIKDGELDSCTIYFKKKSKNLTEEILEIGILMGCLSTIVVIREDVAKAKARLKKECEKVKMPPKGNFSKFKDILDNFKKN